MDMIAIPDFYFGATENWGLITYRETTILNSENVKKLIFDILDELTDLENSDTLEKKINTVLSKIACYGSIRSGRMLRTEEMNSLLREMENTPNSGQCNHGRPTHISIRMSDIERLFGRR